MLMLPSFIAAYERGSIRAIFPDAGLTVHASATLYHADDETRARMAGWDDGTITAGTLIDCLHVDAAVLFAVDEPITRKMVVIDHDDAQDNDLRVQIAAFHAAIGWHYFSMQIWLCRCSAAWLDWGTQQPKVRATYVATVAAHDTTAHTG